MAQESVANNAVGDEPERSQSRSRPGLVDDWSGLSGYRIQIKLDERILRSGLVEDVTNDGRMLWVAAEGALERKLIDQGSGYQVFLDPDQQASLTSRRRE